MKKIELVGFTKYSFLMFCLLKPLDAFPVDMSELDCVIDSFDRVDIGSQVRGILEDVKVKRGDRVEEGQVLATLKADVEKTSVKLARVKANTNIIVKGKHARYEFSKRSLKRVKGLHQKKMISSSELDESETAKIIAELEEQEAKLEKRLARLELEQAVEVLKLRTLKSPIDGLIVEQHKSPGEYLEEDPVLTIVKNDPLKIEVIAPVSMFGSITENMSAIIIPEQPIGGQYIAKVIIVDNIVDAASGTFGIRLELPNPEYKIPSGLQCQIEFIKDSKLD